MLRKQHFFLAILILSGVIISVGIFFIIDYIKITLQENFINYYAGQERLIAKQVALRFETDILGIEKQLKIIGEVPEVNVNGKECSAKIQDILNKISSRLINVTRVGSDGSFICSSNPEWFENDPKILETQSTQIFTDIKRKSSSNSVFKNDDYEYLTTIQVTLFGAGGNFNGTISASIPFKVFQEKYLKDILFAKRGFVILLDEDGTILYHQNHELVGENYNSEIVSNFIGDSSHFELILKTVEAGEGGVASYNHKSEGPKIAGFEPVNLAGGRKWVSIVTMPKSVIKQELIGIQIQQLMESAAWFIVATIIFFLSLFFFMVRKYVFLPLNKIDQMKNEFVSLASHQLRTPLTSIKWNAELLLNNKANLNDDLIENIKEIEGATERMVDLVNSLLNVSRLELGTFAIQPVESDIAKLAEVAIQEQMPEFLLKKQQFSFSCPDILPKLLLDQKVIHIVIQNLLSNACKYTKEEGKIKLIISMKQNNILGKHVLISCIDNGHGIPLEQQKYLFNKFFRADNAKSLNIEGTGLGLFIIKTLVQTSGCNITFTSKEGEGTAFFVRIPLFGMKAQSVNKINTV